MEDKMSANVSHSAMLLLNLNLRTRCCTVRISIDQAIFARESKGHHPALARQGVVMAKPSKPTRSRKAPQSIEGESQKSEDIADDILHDPDKIIGRLIRQLESDFDSDFYLYAGPLERQFEQRQLILVKHRSERRKHAVLFLETYGGHADAAYKIAKAFKRNYQSFTVMVNSDCKSAGTLLSLGADHLVMSDTAELGPLDVQIPKEGEFSGRRSGLDITDTLGALQSESIRLMRQHFIDLRLGSGQQISTRDALDNATKIVCGLLAPVYAQINPMSLGESARSNSIAYHYGQRLAKGNIHPGALEKLISGYPSHGFVIDREEAKELFSSVREPTTTEEIVMMLLAQKHEQLASRRSALILCLSEDYSDQLPKQESNSHESQPSSRKPSLSEPKSSPEPASLRPDRIQPNGGGIDGNANGNAQPNAVDVGAKNANTVPRRAAATRKRVRKVDQPPAVE